VKLQYNSPVILTFTLISMSVLILDQLTGQSVGPAFFTTPPFFRWSSPLDYFRLFSHIFGHANWAHLINNFAFILLIGPILEEKYGSLTLFEMILTTAVATGLIQTIFFDSLLMGASGIVFMLIILGSLTNIKEGEIPITFVLIVLLYLTREFIHIFQKDSVSQLAHILGGICGSVFGFLNLHQPPDDSVAGDRKRLPINGP
jgi:membrane associated rhomboid family serine protease